MNFTAIDLTNGLDDAILAASAQPASGCDLAEFFCVPERVFSGMATGQAARATRLLHMDIRLFFEISGSAQYADN